MSISIGQVTLTVNTPGIFGSVPNMGVQGVIITNDSPFNVAISLQGTTAGGTLLPETADFFPVRIGFNGNITYNPTQVITNPASYTAAQLNFDIVGLGEPFNPGAYPVALSRAAVNPTATGNPLFSASVGFGSTVGIKQILNIFNPANSALNYIFHAARCFTNDSSLPTVNLALISGADNNLATAVSAVCHTLQKNPPVSTAHCTAVDQNAGIIGSNPIVEVMDQQQDVTQDMLAFPDVVTLTPGNNLVFELSAGGTGKIVRLTLKWEEGVAIPAPSLASIPLLTASTVVNDNSAAVIGVVEARKSGDSSADLLLNNDGSATFKGDITASGTGTGLAVANNETVGGTLGVTGATTLSGGLASTGGAQTITGNAAGALHLGQSATGDTLDTTATDTFLKSGNAIHFQIPSGTDQAIVNGSGLNFKTIGNIAAGFQVIGDTSISQAGTSVAHSLGVIPQLVIPVLDAGAAGSADVIKINYGTMTSSHFTAYTTNAAGTGNVRFLVLA